MFAAELRRLEVPAPLTHGPELPPTWKQIVRPVEPFLAQVSQRLTEQVQTFDPEIASYAQYALTNQGKQLRPALVALSAGTVGEATDSSVTVAVIIEMVHLATLVHDDVMDEAVLRRRRLTLAANWGNEIAVLFGDCLFAQALKLAASFPTPEICRAVAMATNTVCAGEILQTQHRRDFNFTRKDYFKVLEMKTAELFALSCELSAFLSGTALDVRHVLRHFGIAFGTAYQLYDDCVDLFGSEVMAGKSLGTDLARGKLTLPVLLLWERADASDRRRLEDLVQCWQIDSMERLTKLLAQYETLGPSLETIHEYLEISRQRLRDLQASDGRAGLLGLTEYLARQTDALGICA